MKRSVYVDYINDNPDGSIEVGYRIDDGPQSSQVYSNNSAMQDGANQFSTNYPALQLALAAWQGVDPAMSNYQLATEYITEVDYTALVPVRRVLIL